MSFNRATILRHHYIEEIRKWDWAALVNRLRSHSSDPDSSMLDEDNGDVIGILYIGSVFNLTPSGKVYAFWTTNQTRHDEERDQAWWEALDKVCEENNCFVMDVDGAGGDDVFLGMRFDAPTGEGEDESGRETDGTDIGDPAG